MTDTGDVLRRYADAWRAGDRDGMLALVADDVELHLLGHSPLAGVYKGKDELARVVATVQELTNRELVDIHDVMANERHGAILASERMERDGTTLDLNRVFVYHFRDGKIGDIWVYDYDQVAVDELWS